MGGRSCTDAELLLHPELLSQEFLLLTLEQVGHSGPTEDRRAAGGRAGLREARGRSPPTQIRWGLPSSQPQRKPRESGWNTRKKPKTILGSSERASQTTSATSVQATAYGREGLGEETGGRSLVQPGLDPEHLRNSLLLSFSPPVETQKLSPRESPTVLLPRIAM